MEKYCKHCVYRLDVPALKSNNEDGSNICGMTLSTEKNALGQTVLKLYDKMQHCDECGQVTQDNREIKYKKCLVKNNNLKCTDFKPKWYFKLLSRK